MKKAVLITLVVCLSAASFGQSSADSLYYNRLYYTCKVWGFVKYFHPRVADRSVLMDGILMNALPNIKNAPNDSVFNAILLRMIQEPGAVPVPTSPRPVAPKNLSFNLDLLWFNDNFLSEKVRGGLDTLYQRFRPQSHYLIMDQMGSGIPNVMYQEESSFYKNLQNESMRFLALFRFWNMIRYFHAYSNMMHQDWDTTLREFIPRFSVFTTEESFALTFNELATRLNTAHAAMSGELLDSIFGTFYPSFILAHIGGETVISEVESGVTAVKAGDIVRKIDGYDIVPLRDSIKRYISWGNEAGLNWILDNWYIIRGKQGEFNMVVENQEGIHAVRMSRSRTLPVNYIEKPGPRHWRDTLLNGSKKVAIVDVEYLYPDSIPPMGTSFWDSDYIIFDLRCYPPGTLLRLPDYLFPEPVHVAKFLYPDLKFPGTYYVRDKYKGGEGDACYQGQIMILINEECISQAEFTIQIIKKFPGAITIGRQTRGADGDVNYVFLLGQLQTLFEVLAVMDADSSQVQQIGIVPDIPVTLTIKGLREGKDEDLETALSIISTSISKERLPQTDSLLVFPNPASHQVTIQYARWLPGQTLNIKNMQGQIIFHIPVSQEFTIIQTSDIPAGIYYVEIISHEGRISKKLLVI